MSTPYFFGYGSLVNRATHDYPAAQPAKITGWRREWRHLKGRELALLTAVRDGASSIDGLIAAVPGDNWVALDEREDWYKRESTMDVDHALAAIADIQVYHSPRDLHPLSPSENPVLLSYIDVVVQGFFSEYGDAGVARFFETTDGWSLPILDDRAAPVYPRHQTLHASEAALVDAHLAALNANILATEDYRLTWNN